MAKTIGRNINTNDIATTSVITLNTSTAVKIADANPNRIYFYVDFAGSITDMDIFIKLQAASVDNDAEGIWIGHLVTGVNLFSVPSWKMPTDNIYTGEISAILRSGSADVTVVEY